MLMGGDVIWGGEAGSMGGQVDFFDGARCEAGLCGVK